MQRHQRLDALGDTADRIYEVDPEPVALRFAGCRSDAPHGGGGRKRVGQVEVQRHRSGARRTPLRAHQEHARVGHLAGGSLDRGPMMSGEPYREHDLHSPPRVGCLHS